MCPAQADAAVADKDSSRVMALLAAEQVTAQLKASQALEQHVVSKFLHNLCEQVCLPSSDLVCSFALQLMLGSS